MLSKNFDLLLHSYLNERLTHGTRQDADRKEIPPDKPVTPMLRLIEKIMVFFNQKYHLIR